MISSWLLPIAAHAQTYEIDGQQPQSQASPANPGTKQQKKGQQSQATSGDNGIGWGSSIEVGRLARAAEDALRRGNPTAAADYAQRAVDAAPQDNKLWFLLGYTSRLAGRYQQSVDAYEHGLKASPGNLDGMSGLAQTYERMGRTDDAQRLLMQVIHANPGRTQDLLIAGELYMRTGDTQTGISLLQQAEAKQPNARAELMLAVAYLKLKQPDRAKQMLDLAKKHSPRLTAALLASPEVLQNRFRVFCGFSPSMSKSCWYQTNIPNLWRYGRNRVRNLFYDPDADVERLMKPARMPVGPAAESSLTTTHAALTPAGAAKTISEFEIHGPR